MLQSDRIGLLCLIISVTLWADANAVVTEDDILNATVTASSQYDATHGPDKGNDGVFAGQDVQNFWASSNNRDVGAWWQMDIGKSVSIHELEVEFRCFGGVYHFVPKTMTFQVSDDGATWRTVISRSTDVPSNGRSPSGSPYTYALNTEGRFVRLLFEDGTEDRVAGVKCVEVVEVTLPCKEDGALSYELGDPNAPGPFELQLSRGLAESADPKASVRRHAAERLGMLRAYAAEPRLIALLQDPQPEVRRQAAQSLAWCGGRRAVTALVKSLDDLDWMTRQTAAYSLENLTGMDFPFNALSASGEQKRQRETWRTWCEGLKPGVVPAALTVLADSGNTDELLRAVRALGALGGEGAARQVVKILDCTLELTRPVIDLYQGKPGGELQDVDEAPMAIQQAGLRALGRLRDPDTFEVLAKALRSSYRARYAADALGEWGDPKAVPLLVEMLRTGTLCRDIIAMGRLDDRFGAHNGGPHTNPDAFFIISALCRLPLSDSQCGQVRALAYEILYQTPWVYDRGVELKPHAIHLYAGHLLDKVGLAKPLAAALLAQARGTAIRRTSLPSGIRNRIGLFNPSGIGWLCARPESIPELIDMLVAGPAGPPSDASAPAREFGLQNMNRIMAAKALVALQHKPAGARMHQLLAASKSDASYGYGVQHRRSEYLDPPPRWRAVFALALGELAHTESAPLLTRLTESEEECLDTRYAAARALGELGSPEALASLRRAAVGHSFHSVRIVAREYLVRHNVDWERGADRAALAILPRDSLVQPAPPLVPGQLPEALVFIKGDPAIQRFYFQDPWRQVYHLTDNGAEPRLGRNLFVLNLETGQARPLTRFVDGFVGSCEVSYDGRRVLFARRSAERPWWHVFEINTDGSNLRQLTRGPYHHANPNYLPDGRIIFITTRLGNRDEYHQYPAFGMAVMTPDGTDIQVVGINVARDGEPAVLRDGRVVFNRVDNIYGMLKIENLLYTMLPDGTQLQNLYGPERRAFWTDLTYRKYQQNWAWKAFDRFGAVIVTQPQDNAGGSGVVACSPFGLIEVGSDRSRERFLHDVSWAVTTPFPLGKGAFLCAAAKRNMDKFGLDVKTDTNSLYHRLKLNSGAQPGNYTGPFFPNEAALEMNADLGLYLFDSHTRSLRLLYHDPLWASYEARPIASRPRPAIPPVRYDRRGPTGVIQCQSIFNTRDSDVSPRGRWIRIIDSKAFNQRHDPQFHNHQGSVARILGTFPVATDGSFNLEVTADQLLQCQVLDADRVPVGTQYIWMTIRPGEVRGCIGCHERPTTTPVAKPFLAMRQPAVRAFPDGGEFTYEATTARRFYAFIPTTTEEALSLTASFSVLARP